MTSFAARYNKGNKFEIDTTGYDYIKLSDLKIGVVYPLLGVYVNFKSMYGPAPVAIIERHFVNLPTHMLNDVQDILSDGESIAAIKDGKVGFSVREYVDGKNVTRRSIRWEDINV